MLEEQVKVEEQIKTDGVTMAREAAPAVTVTVKVYGRHNLLLAEQVTLGTGELTLPDGQVCQYEHPTALAALALALEKKGISWSARSFNEDREIIQLANEPGPWDWALLSGGENEGIWKDKVGVLNLTPLQGANELKELALSGGEVLVVYSLMTGKMPVPLMTGKMPVPLEEGLKQAERLQFNGLAIESQGPEVE